MLKEPSSSKAYLAEIYRQSSEVAELARLGKEFFHIVRSRDIEGWPEWLEAALKVLSAASPPVWLETNLLCKLP